MKNKNLLLIGLLLGTGALLLFSKSDAAGQQPTPDQNPDPGPVPAPVVLNTSLVLARGSRGPEVGELQRRLNLGQDGIFGTQTENALYGRKGVKQISLDGFDRKADVNNNALPVGSRVMSNRAAGTPTYANQTLANGQYSNTGQLAGTVAYGEEIGTIAAVTADGLHYVVNPGLFSPLVWVLVANVVKI